MNIEDADARFLVQEIQRANAVLVIGAGAVVGCQNSSGAPLKTGTELARVIAERAGLTYNDERLDLVLDAARLPAMALNGILETEFRNCRPSDDIQQLLSVPWYRLYTFNIDDCLDGVHPASGQTLYRYNGIDGSVSTHDGPRSLQVVHLNGYVRELERGVIFSGIQYSQALSKPDASWYREAAKDYLSHCPIFIGTKLQEPLLAREIERTRQNTYLSRAYLIVPDKLSVIEIESYKTRGITLLQGTLGEFGRFLRTQFPNGLKWDKVVASQANISTPTNVLTLTKDEIDALRTARSIRAKDLNSRWSSREPLEKGRIARAFLQGAPPTWELAASDVPAPLSENPKLLEFLTDNISKNARLLVIIGDAGAGKSTSAMSELLKLSVMQEEAVELIEISAETTSISATVRAVMKLVPDKRLVVFISDLFLFASALAVDLQRLEADPVTIVAVARSSEWASNQRRHLGHIAKVYEFRRFVEADEAILIDRLVRYVPAPEFRDLPYEQKVKRLRATQQQLLIVLRQATESDLFDNIITQEYSRLPKGDIRNLFCIVGVTTLARVGIREEAAYSAYTSQRASISFAQALDSLSGIVVRTAGGRLIARHDHYVRHLVNRIIPYREFVTAVVSVLSEFIGFETPMIRRLGRQDAQIFRYLLNADMLYSTAKMHGIEGDGLQVYEHFEVHFQRDGHYWLQYALYLDKLGRLKEAESMLRKSIAAYPGFFFAQHALARVQLRLAAMPETDPFDADNLMKSAVESLINLDVRDPEYLDTYPIVSLARYHVEALIKLGRKEDATKAAIKYTERLNEVAKKANDSIVAASRQLLAVFISTGEWRPKAKDFWDA